MKTQITQISLSNADESYADETSVNHPDLSEWDEPD